MKFIINPPLKSLSKAYLKQSLKREQIELFSPDVPQLEAEIDRLVYDLYGLTEEEIAVVEGKR